MLEYIYGPAGSGKTAYAKRLEITSNNGYVFVDAALYPNKKDIDSIATCYAANSENIVIDNAHLLTPENVATLRYLVDKFDINIRAVGLKTDTDLSLFEAAGCLFALCDLATQMEVYCECGEPAIFSIRVDRNNNAILYGEQIDVKASYKPVCSKCHRRMKAEAIAEAGRTMIRELQDECGI